MADAASMLSAANVDGAGPLLALLALGLAVGIAAIWLVVRARKPRRLPVLTEVIDARAQPRGAWRALGDGILQMVQALRYVSERREWRYALPWILVCGEVGSGKTSALASITAGRRDRLTAAEAKLGIAGTGWHFHERGVSIDVDSDASFAADEAVAQRRWKDVLRQLLDYRPERALDGLVLTISARTLLTGSAADAQRLATRCHALLWDAQERFEFALPVYVIVTRCDAISGFGAFWKAQPEQRLREIFGWSNPYSVESTFVPEWLDEAFDEMGRALKRLQLQAAAGDAEIDRADEFFLFPQRFGELAPRLRAVLAQVFRASAYHANSFFRGVYFTGSAAADGATSPVPRADVAFVDRLFEEKIYAEMNLTRPIRQALWSRHRLIRRLQYGAAGLFALLCLALAHAGVRLHRQVGAGIASLDLIEHPQRLSHAAGGCIDKETVYELLANVSSLDVSLTFAAIPASWVDRHISQREIQLVADKAFEEVIFPSLACHLEQRARALLADPFGHAQAGAAPREERDNLRDYLDTVAAFERNLAHFNRLVVYASSDQADELLNRFDQLAQYVYGDPLPSVVHERRGQHREALAHVAYRRPLDLPPDLRATIGRRIEAQTEQVRREIDRQIDTGAMLLDALNREQAPILANAQRFDRWLERMRQEWLAANDQSNPCRAIAQWLDPALHELRGQYGYDARLTELAHRFDRGPCYDPSVRRIAELHVAPHGVLFHRAADRFELTPAFAAEADGMKRITALDFMQLAPQAPFVCQAPLNGWRASDLGEATAYVREYQEFTRTVGADVQRPLYVRLARRQLQSVLDDTLNRAQLRAGYDAARATAAIEALSNSDQQLEQQSSDLARTLDSLLWVLGMYRQLGFDAANARVTQCARNYALYALRTIQNLSEASGLYEPVASGGDESDPDRLLFELGGEAQAKDYLDRQLSRVQVLAGYAAPFIALLKNTDGVSDAPLPAESGGYWDATLQELNRYVQFKVPNGQVALLHDFFGKQLTRLTADDCDRILAAYTPAPYGNDLFSRRRRSAEHQAQWLCRDHTRAVAHVQYRALAQQFAAELAGRFPFGPTPGPDAPLAAVRRFFQDYARNRDGLRARVAGSRVDGADDVAAFLDQLDQAAGFFGPNLASESAPTLRARVEFRAQARRSVGAQNVVSWRFGTSDQPASYPNGRSETEWRYGQPVSFELTWADLAAVAPQPDAQQSDLRVDRNIVTFSAEGPWALLRLMQQHAPLAAPRFDPNDPATVLLEFRVPTRAKEGDETAASEARVYVGLKFYGVDPKTQTAIALRPPRTFPAYAPTVW